MTQIETELSRKVLGKLLVRWRTFIRPKLNPTVHCDGGAEAIDNAFGGEVRLNAGKLVKS